MIEFKDVEIYWINNSSNVERFEHMKKLLEKHFPKNKHIRIDAVMHNPKYQGVTMAHTISLMKGLTSCKPFIVLEDDVTIDEVRIEEIEEIMNIDKKPDVIYLGLSTWGTRTGHHMEIFKNFKKNVMVWEKKVLFNRGAKGCDIGSTTFIKLDDMYGAHAILYLNREYVLKTLKYCIMAVECNKPHDIFLPKLMRSNYVVGLRVPWFYQLARIGGQEGATRVRLDRLEEIRLEGEK